MVKLGTVPNHFDAGQNYVVALASLGFSLCLVVVVLGIKFRWFKQRLSFEPIPTGAGGSSDNGQVVLKRASRASQEQFCEPVMVQGVFRRRLDEDAIIERPKTLPPVRIRKSSRGPPTFGPPKRVERPITPVEEPVVIPPPPPPLPSISSKVSLTHNASSTSFTSRTRTVPKDDGKVSFNASTSIIANGQGVSETYEELRSPEDQSAISYSERRPTGYVRPTDEMMEELNQLERETPEIQQRIAVASTTERPKETFKKNPTKTARITLEPLKGDDDRTENYQISQRRLTGYYPRSNGGSEIPEELFKHCSERKGQSKVAFHLSDEDDDDDNNENNSDDEREEEPQQIPSPPVLLSTQLSTEEVANAPDSWSAIQRHRNLAQEISEEHEARQSRKRENMEEQQQPKPRTMRDMKRNNAKQDLFLANDRKDFDA